MPNHHKDQDIKEAMRVLTTPITGKKKRTEDRLAEEAQEFFAKSWDELPLAKILPEDLQPERIYKTQRFLNQIARHPKPLPMLYTAVLRQFLDRIGITWPSGVFKHNPTSPGSGRRSSWLGQEAAAQKLQGHSWGGIAKDLLATEYKASRKAATDKVRHAGTRYLATMSRERRKTGNSLSARRRN